MKFNLVSFRLEQNILYKIIIFKNIEKVPEVKENSTDYGEKKV